MPKARDKSALEKKGRATEKAASAKKRAPVGAATPVAMKAPPKSPARVPRSTKRSALAEATHKPKKAKRARAGKPSTAPRPAPVAPKSRVAAPGYGVVHTPAPGALPPSPYVHAAPGHDGGHPHAPGQEGGDQGAHPGHLMELHWGDDVPSSKHGHGLVQRWVKRGDALLRRLAEHGAARHEYRADLKEGRFVWVDPEGRVSAEAQAQVLCSWSRSTSSLSMAWADPLVRGVGIGRVDGMAPERDDVDEETAWRVAMKAADRAGAEYLYRVNSPHAWYFLALSQLTFHPERTSFTPSTPVGLVRRGLAETLHAVESRAEPAEIVRMRLTSLGEALLFEAEYAYRGTDWVARLERTGRRLTALGEQLPRASYGSLAAGRLIGEWLDRQATVELSDALALLEDEWALFG